jgi:hypothetical protein
MKRHGLTSLVLAALVGGLAIHALLEACGSGGKPAGAQSSGSYKQWAFVALESSSSLASIPGPVFPKGKFTGEDATSALAPEGGSLSPMG